MSKTIFLVANGDLRPSANQKCWPVQAEVEAAVIAAIKAELGASGMKDMGRVMAELKARHATSLDMSKASGLVKAALAG